MSVEDPIRNKLSPGARFHRCALQVNPHHYAKTYQGQAPVITTRQRAGYAEAIVGHAFARDIDVLAANLLSETGEQD